MKQLLLVLLAINAVLETPIAEAADSGWGIWEDSAQDRTYAILRNNELKLWGKTGTWNQNTKQTTYSPRKTEGVWTSGEAICWLGDKKQQVGNLMIYADSLQCCMLARFLGTKLVLTEVWQKGSDTLGVCNSGVLNRATETPDQRIAREQAEIEREGAKQQRMHAELMREVARKDAATKSLSEQSQAQDAKVCPDVIAQYKIIENTFSKPMLWRGCDEERERIKAGQYTVEQVHYPTAVECPEQYVQYKKMERKYDRPQLWSGCSGSYH